MDFMRILPWSKHRFMFMKISDIDYDTHFQEFPVQIHHPYIKTPFPLHCITLYCILCIEKTTTLMDASSRKAYVLVSKSHVNFMSFVYMFEEEDILNSKNYIIAKSTLAAD